jgi:AraC family transcriptional regulator, positive regulator of tynA and feaB
MKKKILRFSTEDVPQKDSIDYWAGVICEKYLELDAISLETEGRFWSAVELARIGLLRVFHSYGSPQIGVRRRSAALKCTHASYALVTALGQRWTLESTEGFFEMAPGDVALLDTSKPFSTRYHEHMNVHVYELPRVWVHSWVDEAAAQSMPRIDSSTGWGRVLSGLTHALSPEFAISEVFSEELLVSHFGATLALAKRTPLSQEKVSKGGLDSVVEGVLSLIEQRFAEPDLSGGEIARELQISERTMYRALERGGHTFFGLLARKRMSEARRLLSDRRSHDNLSLAEIGRRVGYPQPSQFSRAFSKLQGMTPSQFRHQAH